MGNSYSNGKATHLVDDSAPTTNYASTENANIPNERSQPSNGIETARKLVIGCFIVVGIAVSWVGATQFSQSTYSETFYAPYFNVWFSTAWMILCYPVFIVGAWIVRPSSRSIEGTKVLQRESENIFGPRGLTLKSFSFMIIPFCLLWMATNYMYVWALGIIAAADVTALFSSNTAFIYICSWIWLEERLALLPARGTSVLLSIAGIVLISFAEGFEGTNSKGIFLSIGSAIGAAIYKVLFKKYVGDAKYGQVSLFLSLIGVFNILVLWPFVLIVYYTGFETWEWDDMPWDFLCGSAALSVVFNFLINFGIAVTFPLFIALGTVVGIPLNAVVDLVFRDKTFGTIKIYGTCCIILGFVIMIIPEHIQEKVACCFRPRESPEHTNEDVKIPAENTTYKDSENQLVT